MAIRDIGGFAGGGKFTTPLANRLINTSRQLRLSELGKSLGISQGRINPWELPEYRPAAEAVRAGSERTLSSLPSLLQRSGVSGPAAGLTLERTADQGNDALFNLVNQLRSERTGTGLNLAGNEEQSYQGLIGKDLSLADMLSREKMFGKQERQQNKLSNREFGMSLLNSILSSAASGAQAYGQGQDREQFQQLLKILAMSGGM